MSTSRRRTIRALSHLVQAYARHHQLRRRDKVCRHAISVSQCYALEAIVSAGSMTVTDLGRDLQVNKSSASRVAESLMALGLVDFTVPAGNARQKIVSATERGRALAERIHRDIEVEHSRAIGAFSDREIETAHRLLTALMGPRAHTRSHP